MTSNSKFFFKKIIIKCQKNVKIFLVKFFSNFTLISVYFFGKLVTIASYLVISVYSRQIPLILGLFMVNQKVKLL